MLNFKFFSLLLCLLFNLEQIFRRLKQEEKKNEETKTENGTLTMFHLLFLILWF